MCNTTCINFGRQNLAEEEIRSKRVIEVGSHDVNGSLRPLIESMRPAEYIGVDIVPGYGVDIICQAEEIRRRFGDEHFDVVVSTELLEHVLDWRKVISNIKNICRQRGVVVITTRSKGYEYHGWPYDFWRFEPSDMKTIFSDFIIKKVEGDSLEPGVFIKAEKPVNYHEKDLTDMALYSIVADRRLSTINDATISQFLKIHAEEFRTLKRQPLRSRIRNIRRDIWWRLTRSTR